MTCEHSSLDILWMSRMRPWLSLSSQPMRLSSRVMMILDGFIACRVGF